MVLFHKENNLSVNQLHCTFLIDYKDLFYKSQMSVKWSTLVMPYVTETQVEDWFWVNSSFESIQIKI